MGGNVIRYVAPDSDGNHQYLPGHWARRHLDLARTGLGWQNGGPRTWSSPRGRGTAYGDEDCLAVRERAGSSSGPLRLVCGVAALGYGRLMGFAALRAGVAACAVSAFLLTGSATAASLPVRTAAHPGPPSSAPAQPRYVPGELVVRFAPGTAADERRSLNAAQVATEKQRLLVPRAYLLRLAKGRDVPAAARAYERNPNVEFAHPNYIAETGFDDPERLVVLFAVGAAQHRPDGERRRGHSGRRRRRTRGVGRDAGQHRRDRRYRGHRASHMTIPTWRPTSGRTRASPAPGRRRTASTTTATGEWTTFAATTSSRVTTTRMDDNGHGSHVAGTIGAVGNNGTGHHGSELAGAAGSPSDLQPRSVRPVHERGAGRCIRLRGPDGHEGREREHLRGGERADRRHRDRRRPGHPVRRSLPATRTTTTTRTRSTRAGIPPRTSCASPRPTRTTTAPRSPTTEHPRSTWQPRAPAS